jgi:hypothetical protein
VLNALSNLPRARVASDEEVLHLIACRGLFRREMGHVDVHLLAAVLLTDQARLWTHDRRLHEVATEWDVAVTRR